MRFRRIKSWFCPVALSGISMASCGGDDDAADSSAGRGGSGATGGASGGAGKAGRAGSSSGQGGESGGQVDAGASGTSAGAPGAGVPGTGGSDAASGAGGQAGDVVAAAGAGGDSAGAGMGGAGAGGESNPSVSMCALGCQSEDDCAAQTADVRHCDLVSMRCVECNTHSDCIPVASAWPITCTAESGCLTALGETCVEVSGRGHCAAMPDAKTGCPQGEVELSLPKFGVTPAETVEVCGKDSGRCESGRCFTGCTEETDFCTQVLHMGDGDTCDSVSGRCTCQEDGECLFGPQRCNPKTQRCDECGDATHCDGAGKDVCAEGRCGCSSASVCADSRFPAATPVCE